MQEGYRLVGQAQRVCGETGAWSGGEPGCGEIRCPGLPPLWNGYMEGDETGFGAVVLFRCLEGMTQLGANWAKCQHDATWSNSPPKCMAPCSNPVIDNGWLQHWNTSQLVFHGERIQVPRFSRPLRVGDEQGWCEVKCREHHELAIDEPPLCHNGTWSHNPSCQPVRCKAWPPEVPNARLVFSKTDHGARAKYICDLGFRFLHSLPSPADTPPDAQARGERDHHLSLWGVGRGYAEL